jgi:tetratricopeptide (TPR) repeat protein
LAAARPARSLARATGTSSRSAWSPAGWKTGEGPVVVILDDLQWAEPALLDFADQLGMADAGAGILLVCLARPSSGRWQEAEALEPGTVISLAPLPADACGRLAGSFPGLGTMADSELVREAIHSAAGNPLFLEQALALIAGNGAERAAVLPPTAAAVAAARMDRLAPGERSVAQAAAVQGEAFDAGLLAELVPAQARAAVREHLHSLAGQLMIMPDWPAGPGPRWRFRHRVIQEAAYSTLSPQARSEAHQRLAALLERSLADAAAEERDAIIGYHLEQACQASSGAAGTQQPAGLRHRAGALLGSAGQQAYSRADLTGSSAVNLLGRAVAILAEDDPLRRELLPDLVAAQAEVAQYEPAHTTIKAAERLAAAAGDPRLAARIAVEDAWRRFHVDPGTEFAQATKEIEDAVAVLERAGDHRALARPWFASGSCLFSRGLAEPAAVVLQRAVHHARLAGDRRAEIDAAWQVMGPLFWGPTPADEALHLMGELRAQIPPVTQPDAFGLVVEAILSGMLGRAEEAAQQYDLAERMYSELGVSPAEVGTPQYSSRLHLLAGDPRKAAAELKTHWQAVEKRGETGYLSTTAAQLAEALYRLGSYEEALSATETSRQNATADDFGSQMLWRSVRAKVLARSGDYVQAQRLAGESVSIGEPTDYLFVRGDSLYDLAEVLFLAGKGGEAARAAQQAIELYRRKNDQAAVRRTHRLLSSGPA